MAGRVPPELACECVLPERHGTAHKIRRDKSGIGLLSLTRPHLVTFTGVKAGTKPLHELRPSADAACSNFVVKAPITSLCPLVPTPWRENARDPLRGVRPCETRPPYAIRGPQLVFMPCNPS